MKLFLLISALAVFTVSASQLFTEEELTIQFEKFKIDNSKIYSSPAEEAKRKSIFADNLEFIYRHNEERLRGLHTFSVGVTPFADLTPAEFRVRRVISAKDVIVGEKPFREVSRPTNLPPSVDWVAKGMVTPVQNQGQLGASWAFSSVATVESAHAILTGKLVKLSEAQVADCCSPYNGTGSPYDNIFSCIVKETGIDTAASYPTPTGSCAFNAQKIGSKVIGWWDVPFGSEQVLQTDVAYFGPVAVLVDASHASFQLYTGGVYYEPNCSSTTVDLAVAVVGYGTDQTTGAAFWKVKNSWGTSWGEEGYIRMARNRGNNCGIASASSQPNV